MPTLTLTADTTRAERAVRLFHSDQLPFAYVSAINASAIQAQKFQRREQRKSFEVRRPSWVDRSVKFKPRATKKKPEAKLSVDPPGGRRQRDILTQHEPGGIKRPTEGKSLAVPTEHVPRTAAGVIRKAWRPRALKRKRGGTGHRKHFGTFIKKTGRGSAIFFDEDQEGLKPLYWLTPRGRLKPRLNFVSNITKSVEKNFDGNMRVAFKRAVSTRR